MQVRTGSLATKDQHYRPSALFPKPGGREQRDEATWPTMTTSFRGWWSIGSPGPGLA